MPPEHKYSLPPGLRLRQYRIVRLLGHGGFGLTYLADDTNLNRKVAIKELLPIDFAVRETDGTTVVARSEQDKINLEWARRRFVEEGQTLASLHHPSILPIHDIFEEHGTAYLVTAFIEGENLEVWLRNIQQPAEKDLRSIALSLLDALELVHERGYLHRDVKPENILMDRQNRRPILIDFGNARIATGAKTANLTAVLTKGYAPFEQYQTKGRQGPFTDLYALGAVLYRAIKGVAPEDAADRWEDDKVEPLRCRPPAGYGHEFLATVDKALRMRREDRWQTCGEWKAALAVPDRPPSRPPRPAPKPLKVGLAMAALVLLAGAGVGIGLWIHHPPNDVPASDPRDIAIADPADSKVTPESATADHPFVNSLGMKFAPVEITGGPTNGRRILFSVWDTRVQDYGEFANAKGISPGKPSFQQGPTHPVVMVSWDGAKSFCAWLTGKERASGRIGGQDEYRLPSDHEWSCAVGIGRQEKAGESPQKKDKKIEKVYPWGTQWPPPKGAGNYGLPLQGSEFQFTSPVGSFAANKNGLYDMGGNVWQWCEDWYDASHEFRVLRGASWNPHDETHAPPDEVRLQSSARIYVFPSMGDDSDGFRCVLAVSGG